MSSMINELGKVYITSLAKEHPIDALAGAVTFLVTIHNATVETCPPLARDKFDRDRKYIGEMLYQIFASKNPSTTTDILHEDLRVKLSERI